MKETILDWLVLANKAIQASIVVFGSSIVLYNLRHTIRDRVTRAFSALLLFVVIAFFAELAAVRTLSHEFISSWTKLQWLGIAVVPAAQYHLSDSLLSATGDASRTRRLLTALFYAIGLAFFGLVLFTDLIVGDLVTLQRAPHFQAAKLFPLFSFYYWLLTAASILQVWKARLRCLTSTTRRRVTMILAAILAAPLGVFPYMLLSGNSEFDNSILFWLVLLAGNTLIVTMFGLLTYNIAYFGAVSPDRVVRVRLFKFMARVPLSATIVLLVYSMVIRIGSGDSASLSTTVGFAVVATMILVEWAIHAFKKPLEQLFQLTDAPEVRRIQELSERVMTTRDMHQFLESVLASACESLRIPTAFLVSMFAEGPKVELVVGPLVDPADLGSSKALSELARQVSDPAGGLFVPQRQQGGFIPWQNYWLRPLYGSKEHVLVGLLGLKARSATPDLDAEESALIAQLSFLASRALEDRLLQQEVFRAVEGLLPQVAAMQRRRSAAAFGGTPTLATADAEIALDNPEFHTMVREALGHYWGGPKLSESPLVGLRVVQSALDEHEGNTTKALRAILASAIEHQRPEGARNLTTTEWIMYNILQLKFVQGKRVRDIAQRLAMSESDLYRKQRIAIESVTRSIMEMERDLAEEPDSAIATDVQE